MVCAVRGMDMARRGGDGGGLGSSRSRPLATLAQIEVMVTNGTLWIGAPCGGNDVWSAGRGRRQYGDHYERGGEVVVVEGIAHPTR